MKPNPKTKLFEISEVEMKIADTVYENIVNTLQDLNHNNMVNMDEVTNWMVKVVRSNVSLNNPGFHTFGLIKATYQLLCPEPTDKELESVFVLEWLIQFFRGTNKINEELMDDKECGWHRYVGVDMIAVNDSIMLRACTYNILKLFFSDHKHYVNLEFWRRKASDYYHIGQQGYEHTKRNIRSFGKLLSMSKFEHLRRAQAAQFYFIPVAMALTLAHEVPDRDMTRKLVEVMSEISLYFEMQWDYTKLFNCPENYEISAGDLKMNWFFVKTLEVYDETDQEWEGLVKMADAKNVEGLKRIYKENDLLREFLSRKRELEESFPALIEDLEKHYFMPMKLVTFLTSLISPIV